MKYFGFLFMSNFDDRSHNQILAARLLPDLDYVSEWFHFHKRVTLFSSDLFGVVG